MQSNLERFQSTKLHPFQEKIQREYLSTNVRTNMLSFLSECRIKEAFIQPSIKCVHILLFFVAIRKKIQILLGKRTDLSSVLYYHHFPVLNQILI